MSKYALTEFYGKLSTSTEPNFLCSPVADSPRSLRCEIESLMPRVSPPTFLDTSTPAGKRLSHDLRASFSLSSLRLLAALMAAAWVNLHQAKINVSTQPQDALLSKRKEFPVKGQTLFKPLLLFICPRGALHGSPTPIADGTSIYWKHTACIGLNVYRREATHE